MATSQILQHASNGKPVLPVTARAWPPGTALGPVTIGMTYGAAVTQLTEQWPAGCPNGHRFDTNGNPPSVGWVPCGCVSRDPKGHRTYWCLICDVPLYVPQCTAKR